MTTWNEDLRQRALEADKVWHAELVKVFGKQAGDARYVRKGQGEEGSALRLAYDAWRFASDAWQATIQHREPIDKASAVRRLRRRWEEQVEKYPVMREEIPLDLYLSRNVLQVMREGLLSQYEG